MLGFGAVWGSRDCGVVLHIEHGCFGMIRGVTEPEILGRAKSLQRAASMEISPLEGEI